MTRGWATSVWLQAARAKGRARLKHEPYGAHQQQPSTEQITQLAASVLNAALALLGLK
jgi:hypothetical protein